MSILKALFKSVDTADYWLAVRLLKKAQVLGVKQMNYTECVSQIKVLSHSLKRGLTFYSGFWAVCGL